MKNELHRLSDGKLHEQIQRSFEFFVSAKYIPRLSAITFPLSSSIGFHLQSLVGSPSLTSQRTIPYLIWPHCTLASIVFFKLRTPLLLPDCLTLVPDQHIFSFCWQCVTWLKCFSHSRSIQRTAFVRASIIHAGTFSYLFIIQT